MDYEDELNSRLENRNRPSASLKPLFDHRPASTKYTWFQSSDVPRIPKEPLRQYVDYSPKVFNPGNRAPVEYFMKSIDIESKLRSQFMALQKSDQAVYIPEVNSDLYASPGATKQKELTPISIPSRKPPSGLEPFIFGNMTRLNLKK